MAAEDPSDEEWDGWQVRLRHELSGLGAAEALTLMIRPPAPVAESTSPEPTTPRSGRWRRPRAADATPAPALDVFVQARLVAGRLALECIGDTEWEGETTLTAAQQQHLAALGWERDGADPTFSRTYDPEVAPWSEAAALLTTSLRDVLGAAMPADVELRRARSQI